MSLFGTPATDRQNTATTKLNALKATRVTWASPMTNS